MNELILTTVNQGGQAPPGGGLLGLTPLLLMFVIFYFLLIRPQQKRQKAHQKMLGLLKKGDKIVTAGGVIGTIHALTDNELVVEIADKVRIRVIRSQVNMYGVAEADAGKDK